jgi:uncharacterized phage-associated protein
VNNIVPGWVTNLSDDDDNKELLVQLSLQGSVAIETPRKMTFTINMVPEDAIDDILESLGSYGIWEVERSIDHQNNIWLDCTQEGYRISKNKLYADELFFKRLASQHNAQYDGWYTELL